MIFWQPIPLPNARIAMKSKCLTEPVPIAVFMPDVKSLKSVKSLKRPLVVGYSSAGFLAAALVCLLIFAWIRLSRSAFQGLSVAS
jgi:hypothetical protein